MFRRGCIDVIVSCMRGGKSELALHWINQESYGKGRKYLIFQPDIADREVCLTNGEKIETKGRAVSRCGTISHENAIIFPKNDPWKILEFITPDITTVLIEEGHFCHTDLVKVCKILAEKHLIRVIVTGLDQTFLEEPFGPMPHLLCEADHVRKLSAVCMHCGEAPATKSWLHPTYREKVLSGSIHVGDEDYLSVCRHCFRELEANPPKP
ncbi:hypothetical protein HN858_01860 [Candidatus Falkowbacteria bacterium]|jgi:thymidine kinase|nr:hypothetical protein [Candidatus Falkowbacteria bacterium]MBT5503555.1 hypothetical protein [Candidatus Falkowbacteria bacterium]MBT6573592.1 hypothetical protein [Candidatus Falkowbacteria bacterium]MBT7348400.1 hypothetical protein [Candidatus Falkowbacteria bacterium]MBT7500646.1 hypothetical protein [Candidatus Falkowbacteria bacterium]